MSSARSITVNNPLVKSNCTLGEGPLYDPSTGILHFVDIVEKRVFHLNTNTKELVKEQFDEPISCLALRKNGQGLACVTAQGFALINPGSKELTYLSKPLPSDHVGHVRFNDGACDSKGRFFAGTICSSDPKIPGQLYRFDPHTRTATLVDEGPFSDSNGLGWTADERTMFFTDSLVNKILMYDYDDGKLSNRRLFVDTLAIGLPRGTFPDGLCIDSEGGVWSARWGGSKVVRHSQNGSIDFQIDFPTALNVTACCFGGPENDQMYVTTAHCGAINGDASRQQQYFNSGDVFQVNLSGLFKGGVWRHAFGL